MEYAEFAVSQTDPAQAQDQVVTAKRAAVAANDAQRDNLLRGSLYFVFADVLDDVPIVAVRDRNINVGLAADCWRDPGHVRRRGR